MSSLKNKVAFVTGAATGIGRATAIALAAKGAKVMVTDINETEGLKTLEAIQSAGGTGRFYELDVSQKSNIEAVVNAIIQAEGRLDIAVNNAGIPGVTAPLHLIQETDWEKMLAINLSGVLFCMQAEIVSMLQYGGGSIVNISSLAGLGGMPMGSAYAAAKHGVIGLTKSAATEYGAKNIRVNAVCPGFIETAILDGVPDKVLDFSTKFRVPMKRLGKTEEVANTIVWLLSDEASFVNGHSMVIDGGMKAG